MVKESVKRMLKENYEKACNGYLVELLNAWELDSYYGFWVGDEIGGIYCYGDSISINMDEIIYCVTNDISENEYLEYSDYNLQASSLGFDTICLRSWHHGCPRVPQSTFDKINDLKKELTDLIEREKENIKVNTNGTAQLF